MNTLFLCFKMHTLFLLWITLVSAFSLRPSPAVIQVRLQMFLPSKCHPQGWAAFWAVGAAQAWLCHLAACTAHLSVTTLQHQQWLHCRPALSVSCRWNMILFQTSPLFQLFFSLKYYYQNFFLPGGEDLNSLHGCDLYSVLLFHVCPLNV